MSGGISTIHRLHVAIKKRRRTSVSGHREQGSTGPSHQGSAVSRLCLSDATRVKRDKEHQVLDRAFSGRRNHEPPGPGVDLAEERDRVVRIDRRRDPNKRDLDAVHRGDLYQGLAPGLPSTSRTSATWTPFTTGSATSDEDNGAVRSHDSGVTFLSENRLSSDRDRGPCGRPAGGTPAETFAAGLVAYTPNREAMQR